MRGYEFQNVNIQSIQQEESGGGRRNHDSARNQEQLLDIGGD